MNCQGSISVDQSVCPSYMGLENWPIIVSSCCHSCLDYALCSTGPVVKKMGCGPDHPGSSNGSAPTSHVSLAGHDTEPHFPFCRGGQVLPVLGRPQETLHKGARARSGQ